MNWTELYSKRLITATEAVKKIKSGDRVVVSHAAAQPQTLIKSMIDNHNLYEKVEIIHMVPMGTLDYINPDMEKHFRHNALFAGKPTRDAINDDRADYTPSFFYQIPRLFTNNYLPLDVALIQVSKPDDHGYCSFGLACDYTKPATKCAKLVIAQINDYMPRTLGDNFIHISEIDYIVESSVPIPELAPPTITDIEKEIGKNCAKLIKDGSTLQIGIGSIPDAVLMFLKDKKDLGIHSEMFSDGVVDLYNAGVITNTKKTLHPNKMVVTFLMGTRKLYDFVDNNPVVEMHSVDYVNNPCVISQNSNMVSINSCLQVDFTGQVSSESIGTKHFTGTGGQVDYVRGASMADNGISIIAMPSTAAKGTISRIVPYLDKGVAVTTSRNDVHFIVTEYGSVDLRGKTLKQRAKELIGISHPDFRPFLLEEFKNIYKK